MGRLGLVPEGFVTGGGRRKFPGPGGALITSLCDAMQKIIDAALEKLPGLHRGFSGDVGRKAFISAALDQEYLRKQIDGLLGQFGEKLWGKDVARRPGCRHHLVLNNDREMLHMLLHMWLFKKIANVMIKRSYGKAVKKDDDHNQGGVRKVSIKTTQSTNTRPKTPLEITHLRMRIARNQWK
ncbi:hypothetical protein BU23DRAFT_229459 [Bimuria novae-zelandiae CBS 107.79]|uniref:Uncharacterized protein n=1 Tax=Bimuria novae-zelandiae CBS 107.79 TaxID=1447943 RepID=A0A6A5VSF4_9PLEO|nr:hypothetical protein BU23DRAFT_229459 [Bimuria novae-zelandiae CBS 107.79]